MTLVTISHGFHGANGGAVVNWYNFETMFRSLKDELTMFLKNCDIRYELSGCGRGWHFKILCAPDDVELVNGFLDKVTL